MRDMVARLKSLVIWFWGLVSRPSAYLSLGFLTLGGFVAGVIARIALQGREHRIGADEYGEVLRWLSRDA